MSREQIPARLAVSVCIVILFAGAWMFHQDLADINVWGEELAIAAESLKQPGEPPLPHLEYRSPAYVGALRAVDAGPMNMSRARTLSWAAAVLALGAAMAAAWGLFSSAEALAAGLLALGSVRMFSAAHSVGPDSFLLASQGLTLVLFCVGLRTGKWVIWIGLFFAGLLLALSGFQGFIPLVVITIMGAAYLYNPGRREGRRDVAPPALPLWQYLSTVPVVLVLSVVWVVSWVLASRGVNPPIPRPPIMHVKYVLFVHEYLWGHVTWALPILGIAMVVGIIGCIRKRVTRIEKLRRVYVDKRYRRPMILLILWALLGIPAINLLLFNAYRPQKPSTLNPLYLPFLLMAASGMVMIVEGLLRALRRMVGLRVPVLAGILVVVGLFSWFGQGVGRKLYRGYRVQKEIHNYWAEAAQFLKPRMRLGHGLIVAPQWAGALMRSELQNVLGDLPFVVPERGSQVDSLAREWSSAWAVVYQSEAYPAVPAGVRQALDRDFEQVARFKGPEYTEVVIMATSWLHVSESQWSEEQEKVAMGGEQEIEARLALAHLYANIGNTADARQELQHVLAREPNRIVGLLELAAVAADEGRMGEAVDLYTRASKIDSANAVIYFGLGKLLFQTNRLPAAARNLERTLVLDPDHLTAAQLLVATYRGLGRTEEYEELERRIESLGGRISLSYEFGRAVALHSLELPMGVWNPGEEVEVQLKWACIRPMTGGVRPDFYLKGTGKMILAPPRGGWHLSMPDSGCELGATAVDALPLRLVYAGLPEHFPDRAQLCMELYENDGEPLPISDLSGSRLPDAVIARIVARREPAERRLSVEAEEMDQHPGFEVPQGINVTEQGIMHEFRFPGGAVRLEIVARGTPAAGQWPKMILDLGGHRVKEFTVSDRQWRTYTVSVTSSPGLRSVRLRFPNDYVNRATGEDRNLIIDKVDLVEEEIKIHLEAP